jgi:Tfp pilus assembly protein PilF
MLLVLGGAIAAGWVGWNVIGRPAAPVSPAAAHLPAFPAPDEPSTEHLESAQPASSTESRSTAADVAPAQMTPPSAALPVQPLIVQARPAAASVRRTPPLASGESAAPPAQANDLDLAIYYHRAGDFENALQHYRALLRRNELDAQAHNNLGLLYQERNLLDESARELQRAIVIEPRNAGTHNNYGVTLLKLGRADEAQAEFTAALALSPRSVDAIVNLALAQRDARQPDIARDTLLRALSIEPRNAAAHYNLAQLYDQTNQTASAVDHYGRFLENAGAEYASRIAAVRIRIEVLSRDPD